MREFRIGSVLSAAAGALAVSWRDLGIIAAIFLLAPGIISALLAPALMGDDPLKPGAANYLLSFVLLLVFFAGMGALSLVAACAAMGRPVEWRAALGRTAERGVTLILAALLYLLAIFGAALLSGLIIGLPLLFWLMTIWFVILPAVLMEDHGVMGSFGRSQYLVKGSGWQVFGLTLLVTLLTLLYTAAFWLLVYGFTMNPLEIQQRALELSKGLGLTHILSQLASAAIITFIAVLAGAAYTHLRRARDGDTPDVLKAVFE